MHSFPSRPASIARRAISVVVIIAHLMSLQPVQMWANEAVAPASNSPAPTAAPAAGTPHATPPPRVKATVNTKQPNVSHVVPALAFSSDPLDAEISRCRLLPEPLLPMGGKTSPQENSALASALLAFSADSQSDHVEALGAFLSAHPKSPWRVSLLTNMGIIARQGCYWSEALEDWKNAWELGKEETEPTRSMVVDRAFGQLAELTARIGRVKELKSLLSKAENRNFRGPAAEKVAQARRSLYLMETEPTKAFRCGPFAVGKVWAALNPQKPVPASVFESTCTDHGTSLTQVAAFAKTLGLDFQMAKRSPGAPILVPCIVNWKVGHFAAVTERLPSGRYMVKDTTFTDDFSASEQALDAESSGYFLVPAGSLPKGWNKVADDEGRKVWGKGQSSPNTLPPPPCTCFTLECPGCQGLAGPDGGGDGGGGAGGAGGDGGGVTGISGIGDIMAQMGALGMAAYDIDPSRVNLTMMDTPLFYNPPHGPAIQFTASYSQRDVAPSSTPNYPNLGAQWNFNWVGFVVDDPSNSATTTYGPGGGTLAYSGYTSTGANTGTFAGQALIHATLERTSASSYIRHFPNGARQVFNLADTSTPKRIFMTEYDDPAGNVISYTYDPTTFRLLSVTDALGQVTTLSYVSDDPAATNGDFYRVASVTDPFGRSATLAYDGLGQLTTITDMVGIVSQFTYGAADFINTLTTPYGNTTFVSADTGSDRTLLVTDPEGGQEYVWFVYNMTPPDPADPVPSASGLLTQPTYNQYRTTYYWDKKAYMEAPGKFSKAHLYHFTHTADLGSMSDILESSKNAYESRVYYNYPGQTNAFTSSGNNLATKVARVLDDGSTQLVQFDYNAQGKRTKAVTPGDGATPSRTTTWTYAANGIDLTAIYQENGAGNSVDSYGAAADLLGSFSYDALGRHLIMTATDASGKTSSFAYNSFGQILTATNAKSETTTFAYDRDQDSDGITDGYLSSVVGPVAAATSSFQYDGFGRLYQATDSEGYTVTITYDAVGGVATKTLNRVAKITYPDGTAAQVLYDRLDPQWSQDRLGRWTEMLYDNMRRLVVMVDPLSRVTQYQWCACGSLETLIDPAGNRSTWMRDEQRRVIRKTYPDATAVLFSYENRTSRPKAVLDAKGQQTNYSYNIDDSVRQISYTDATGNPLSPATPAVSFTYDSVYRRAATMVDGIGTTQYSYNPVGTTPALGAGRLASIDGPWANDTIAYTYDELGRVLSRSINGAGNTASMTYDTLGRVSAGTNVLGTFNYGYVDATGRLEHVTYPSGQKTQFLYYGNTGDQRLQEIKNQDSVGTVISQFDYAYNAVGNITTWTQNNSILTNPRQYVFGYDDVDQLISGRLTDTGTSGVLADEAYRYDAAGNRVTTQSSNTVVTEQPNGSNQLMQTSGGGMMRFAGSVSKPSTVTVGGNSATVNADNTFQGYAHVTASGTTRVHIVATDSSGNVTDNYADITPDLVTPTIFAYDRNGNTVSSGPAGAPNVIYGWDACDRLVTITQGANVMKFDYDGQGRRVRESLNGTEVRHWVWCGMDLCEERNASNNVTKRFFGQGEQIGATNYYFTRDHLGSVREMTDASQVIHARYDYDLYGQRSANLITAAPVDSDFGFTGHYSHTASGLCLAPYRAYSATIGRWLSRDPIGENGGINLYGYVRGNPVSNIDVLGLEVRLYTAPGFNNPYIVHEFFWSTDENEGAGSAGSSGWASGTGVSAGFNPDTWPYPYRVVDTNHLTDREFLDIVEDEGYLVRGLYFPWFNDCHNRAQAAAFAAGAYVPDPSQARVSNWPAAIGTLVLGAIVGAGKVVLEGIESMSGRN